MFKVTWVFEVFLLIGRICTQTDVTKKKHGVGGFKDWLQDDMIYDSHIHFMQCVHYTLGVALSHPQLHMKVYRNPQLNMS